MLPTLIGEGGVVEGSNELVQGAQGIGLEGKLMVLLGMLVVTMITLITAGLLLPVHTGGCTHMIKTGLTGYLQGQSKCLCINGVLSSFQILTALRMSCHLLEAAEHCQCMSEVIGRAGRIVRQQACI